MNGAFDFNGRNEAFDKLSGTRVVTNSFSTTAVTITRELCARSGGHAATVLSNPVHQPVIRSKQKNIKG
jgi:hypothetical protein